MPMNCILAGSRVKQPCFECSKVKRHYGVCGLTLVGSEKIARERLESKAISMPKKTIGYT